MSGNMSGNNEDKSLVKILKGDCDGYIMPLDEAIKWLHYERKVWFMDVVRSAGYKTAIKYVPSVTEYMKNAYRPVTREEAEEYEKNKDNGDYWLNLGIS